MAPSESLCPSFWCTSCQVALCPPMWERPSVDVQGPLGEVCQVSRYLLVPPPGFLGLLTCVEGALREKAAADGGAREGPGASP